MKERMWIGGLVMMLACTMACKDKAETRGGQKIEEAKDDTPVFSLAVSEYPSWSVFLVAHMTGLIDAKKGKMGSIETKHGVDIVLKEADYDTTLTMYGSSEADAVCITNMDALNPSLSRASVAIMPTSTSHGADALIVTDGIASFADLKGKKVYGLEKSVSQYTFDRCVEANGGNPDEFTFRNQDPAAAATAMQQKQASHDAIVVWNPFVMETTRKRSDVKVLCDSTKLPGEIIDMVVVAKASLEKKGGEAFAKAVAEAFYEVNKKIEDSKTRKDTLVALGEKFSNLDAAAMETVVKQTKFYKTPAEGIAVFEGAGLGPIMKKVTDFCVKRQIVEKRPTYGPGKDVQLRFDTSYMKAVK